MDNYKIAHEYGFSPVFASSLTRQLVEHALLEPLPRVAYGNRNNFTATKHLVCDCPKVVVSTKFLVDEQETGKLATEALRSTSRSLASTSFPCL
jgi:hypothetical protein